MHSPHRGGAVLDLGTVLGDFQLGLREIKHLSSQVSFHRGKGNLCCATAGADDGTKRDDVIRRCHLFERMPLMAGLTARFARSLLAQTFWFGLSQPIGRRRLGAVAAVLVEPGLQICHTLGQCLNLCLELQNNLHQGCLIQLEELFTVQLAHNSCRKFLPNG